MQKTLRVVLAAGVAGLMWTSAGPALADTQRDPPRKWSSPSYETPERPLSAAPKLGDFTGAPMDEDRALLGNNSGEAPALPPRREAGR